MPTSPAASGPSPSLAIGPANYAGQATAWAHATKQHLGLQAWSFSRTQSFNFPVDRRLPAMTGWKERRMPVESSGIHESLAEATHVAMDGFLALSGGRWTADLDSDLEALADESYQVALIAHGSDVRDPVAHLRRVPHSWWRTAGVKYFAQTLRTSRRNRRRVATFGFPVFVSTPDLLHDLPDATWLPLTVDPSPWQAGDAALDGTRRPRVLHLPSRRRPAIKGSETVDRVALDLAKAGRIEYVRPGRLCHDEFRAMVKSVDVVIDQIRSDAYGVTTIEALAANRLAICSVGGTRDVIGRDVPVVEATPATLARVLEDVVRRPDHYREVAERGMGYVSSVHDGRAAANALRPFLESQR